MLHYYKYIFGVLLILLVCCKKEKVPKEYLPRNAHEAYFRSLRDAGLASTALAEDWMEMAHKALINPLEITLPFEEEFYFDPSEPNSNGYRFFVNRGQRISIDVEIIGRDSSTYFIDLFREKETQIKEWWAIASANDSTLGLEYKARQYNWYILRIQPELLRGGQCKVTIFKTPSLKFPVSEKNSRNIGSFFNAPRDGGKRRHHGVDIFASRHTPVLAPIKAWVRSTGKGNIGGKHVWLYDSEQSIYMYFAHLEKILVQDNIWVYPGDTIGTVGNTGNARTTSPHLHFGIYAGGIGPVDPYHYIAETDTITNGDHSNKNIINEWVRISEPAQFNYFTQQTGTRDTIIEENTVMKVLGISGRSYRVELPNNITGRINEKYIIKSDTIIIQEIQHHNITLYDSPETEAVKKDIIEVGEFLSILGRFNDHWYVKTTQGNMGWVSIHNIAIVL